VLVDGFANGWLVTDPPSGPATFAIDWTPQRIVWVALVVSLLVAAVVLVLMVAGRRRSPRLAGAASADLPADPTLDWLPWAPGRGAAGVLSPTGAWLTGLGVAVFAALNLPEGWWLLALPLGALAVASLRSTRLRNLPAVLALVGLGLAAAYTVLQQFRNRFPPDFVWAGEFSRVHVLGVLAMLAIGIAGLRDLVERRRSGTGGTSHDEVDAGVGAGDGEQGVGNEGDQP
jgi:hypothetical protein